VEQQGSDRPGSSLDATLHEHRDVMQAVAEVEACLDTPPDREGEWVRRLLGSLPELADTLRCHFSAEQEGALYREVPERFPRFAHRLETLGREHGEILRTADDVIASAKSLRGARIYEQRELNARVQLLVATIRRHEAEENEIILSANWDEVGAGD
jgi:hypothetical protein